MTLPFPAALATETDRQSGPNQWIKDHLNSVIDAELLRDTPAETAGDRAGARP